MHEGTICNESPLQRLHHPGYPGCCEGIGVLTRVTNLPFVSKLLVRTGTLLTRYQPFYLGIAQPD